MQLRGIDFGPVWGASGVQGFYGEGYAYHRFLKPFGLDFSDVTFVAKTVTLGPRTGNMPLVPNLFVPKNFFPDCIRVYPFKSMALNAVGLSNYGVSNHLRFNFNNERGTWPAWLRLARPIRWQSRREPFFLSFAMVEEKKRTKAQ